MTICALEIILISKIAVRKENIFFIVYKNTNLFNHLYILKIVFLHFRISLLTKRED